MTLIGTVAVTDYGWYTSLLSQSPLEDVNFWKPSATRATRAPEFSPFLFKLRSPHNAICGFGYFAGYSRLPDWLAWDTFKIANGCNSLAEMRERIASIRDRIRFEGGKAAEIGCVLVVQPTFFPQDRWVSAPKDWSPRTQVDKRYDLSEGEGARVWQECIAAASTLLRADLATHVSTPDSLRYGAPQLVTPRLGQSTFRIAVTDAYRRGCAVTAERSLPALEAAHIKRYADRGPHEVRNGVLLRADLHRLFDKGYVTITTDGRFEVSGHLKQDFENGRSYYPLHGRGLEVPALNQDRPASEFVEWHNAHL
ncbi:MAG TPA: HNH endonuclease [Gemmatimonadales bacterium]|nr:HNH endonuclease [Gemmatimonadales bacterium]